MAKVSTIALLVLAACCQTAYAQFQQQYRTSVLRNIANYNTTNRSARLMEELSSPGGVYELTGVISDAYQDEMDPQFSFFLLSGDETVTYIVLCDQDMTDEDRRRLVGARVSVLGLCDPGYGTNQRRQLGPTLNIPDRESIRVLEPATGDPFNAKELGPLVYYRPYKLPSSGLRRAFGRVIAAWDSSILIERTNNASCVRVEMSNRPLPRTGSFVEVVGRPETDLFRVNLVRANWRETAPWPVAEEPPTNISIRAVMRDEYGRESIDHRLHGRRVRLRGIVKSQAERKDAFLMESDGYTVPIVFGPDADADPKILIGSVVEVTGTFVMDIDNWRPNNEFPQIRGYFVVPRSNADIAILKSTPWWTPARLSVIICTLLAVLVAVLLWNASLRVLAARKGRELMRTRLHDIESELRIDERTKLAAELHDYLSQNLTALGFRITAAIRAAERDLPAARRHLETAERMLESSHAELRRCLWDLRSDILSEHDFGTAIRRCIAPIVGEAETHIRFTVARSRVTDSTAHAVLSVIRELVSNAVRHGHATRVAIAGGMEGDALRFSVKDNGSGFNPDACEGLSSGHLGLEGIRERIKSMHGTFAIESSPGHGTRAEVSLCTAANGKEDD